VFEAAFEAMKELLGDDASGPGRRVTVELEAGDRAALLADWIGELAYLAETERLVPARLAGLELDRTALTAQVEGFWGDPPHLVKAATYHGLVLEPADGGWRASVVLDV
jgi:SHS2 domain-containing protein